MDWIIMLSCIGLAAAQTPADTTYLSLVSSSYITSDPRIHNGRFAASNSADEVQLRELQSNANLTVQDMTAFIGTSDVDRNAQTDRQTARGSLVPQSRLLDAARSQGIPPSLIIPGLSAFLPYSNLASQPNIGATPYNFDLVPTRNDQNQINANSRSNDEPRLNPQYSGPSLFSHSAQATAERRTSPPQYQQPQYQPSNSQSFGVDPSLSLRTLEPSNLIGIQRSLNAAPPSRSSFDEYYSTSDGQSPSNQNNYNIQQITQGNLDPVNYQFSYDVNAVEKGRSVQFAHEEQRGRDQAAGAYSVLLPDGQRQVVEYTADEDGYRPRVSYDGIEGGRTSGGNPASDLYGSYESPVIAARSQSNGGRRSNNYPPQSVQSRLLNRPY